MSSRLDLVSFKGKSPTINSASTSDGTSVEIKADRIDITGQAYYNQYPLSSVTIEWAPCTHGTTYVNFTGWTIVLAQDSTSAANEIIYIATSVDNGVTFVNKSKAQCSTAGQGIQAMYLVPVATIWKTVRGGGGAGAVTVDAWAVKGSVVQWL